MNMMKSLEKQSYQLHSEALFSFWQYLLTGFVFNGALSCTTNRSTLNKRGSSPLGIRALKID